MERSQSGKTYLVALSFSALYRSATRVVLFFVLPRWYGHTMAALQIPPVRHFHPRQAVYSLRCLDDRVSPTFTWTVESWQPQTPGLCAQGLIHSLLDISGASCGRQLEYCAILEREECNALFYDLLS